MKDLTREIIATVAVVAVIVAAAYIVSDNRSDLSRIREELSSRQSAMIGSNSREKAIRALQEKVRKLQRNQNVRSNAKRRGG